MRHSSYLEVNLGLLAQNFAQIQKFAPQAEILPMVKSDAYGNGLVPVSQFLVNECGVKKLGCASLGEALKVFEECPDLKSEIIVFSDTELLNEKARDIYLNYNVTPVLHQKSDLEVVLKNRAFKDLPLRLKINTGMNRLGLNQEDLEEYLPLLKARGVHHLLTHFARADQIFKAGDKSHRQLDEFKRIKNFLIDSGVEVRETSLANSGAIEQQFGVDETYIRPGLMLYGPSSITNSAIWKGHQVSRLVTKVLTSYHVKKGMPIGYGVNVTDRDGFMVVIPMGYGDGLIALGSGTTVTLNGCVGKIFGRINMDMAFIFFETEASSKIKNGDVVELWNHDSRIMADVAAQNKTLPYHLMCGISGRIPRIYKVK